MLLLCKQGNVDFLMSFLAKFSRKCKRTGFKKGQVRTTLKLAHMAHTLLMNVLNSKKYIKGSLLEKEKHSILSNITTAKDETWISKNKGKICYVYKKLNGLGQTFISSLICDFSVYFYWQCNNKSVIANNSEKIT